MGTQEAISCGVPMIGIPIFADQFANVANYVEKNIAIKLDYENLSQDDLDAALNAILHNSTYRYESSTSVVNAFVAFCRFKVNSLKKHTTYTYVNIRI